MGTEEGGCSIRPFSFIKAQHERHCNGPKGTWWLSGELLLVVGGSTTYHEDTPRLWVHWRPRCAAKPQSPLWDYGAPRSVPPRRGKSCLSFSSITHPNLHGDPLYSSVWLHEEVGQLQRDLPHDVTVTMETNIPGVPVDSGHHEHGPAQPVPRIHVGAFQQQPAQKRDTGQKRYRSRERCQSEGWRASVPSRGKAEYCTSHTARPNGKS